MFINKCQRCGNKNPHFLRCSYFNTEMICERCCDKEAKHELYKLAKSIENIEVLRGNYNFEGIGLPKELRS